MPAIDRNHSCTSGSMPSSSEDTNTVDNEGERGLLVEQGAYYPVDNYYGYYSNGLYVGLCTIFYFGHA